MNPILNLIADTFNKKEPKNLIRFIDSHKAQNEFYLVINYCLEESDKLNDVFSFSLLPINKKEINDSLAIYVDSPLAYHFSFALPNENKFLEHFYTKENLITELDSLNTILNSKIPEDPTKLTDFFLVIKKRSGQLIDKIESSTSDEILARKIILTGFFSASIIHLIKKISASTKIVWVADFNHEIIDTCDGFAYDFMLMQYILFSNHNYESYEDIDILFELSGQDFFKELNKIPHYIANTLASVDLENKKNDLQQEQDSNNQTNIKVEIKNAVLSAENV